MCCTLQTSSLHHEWLKSLLQNQECCCCYLLCDRKQWNLTLTHLWEPSWSSSAPRSQQCPPRSRCPAATASCGHEQHLHQHPGSVWPLQTSTWRVRPNSLDLPASQEWPLHSQSVLWKTGQNQVAVTEQRCWEGSGSDTISPAHRQILFKLCISWCLCRFSCAFLV